MIHINLNGESIPALGFGTWRLDGDEARDTVAHALDLGYRHIDTAQIYDNEVEVGEGLRASDVDRDAVFLTTKVWRDKMRYRDVIASTDDSLRKLNVEVVDLLLIHWPNDEVELAETLDALQEVQHAEKARHIGVSNFTPSLIHEAVRHAPGLVCNQVEYHPYLDQSDLLEVMREHEMFLTAYSPIARGKVMDDEVIRAIAEGHGKSPVQVTLRWLLQQDRVSAIPKAASARHRTSNLDIFDFALSDDEMAEITALAQPDGRMISPDFAPAWDA